MWGLHDFGWGLGVVLWLFAVWAAVLITVWFIFRNMGGPRHHLPR